MEGCDATLMGKPLDLQRGDQSAGEPLLPQESGKGQDWGEMEGTEAFRGCFTRGHMRNSVYLQH